VLVDGEQLPRLDLADEAGTDDVQGRGLARDHPAALESAQDQGPYAVGVPGGVQGVVVHEGERERAPQGRQHLHGNSLGRQVGTRGEQRSDQVGVGGGPHAGVRATERGDPTGELAGVRQVAVVAEREAAAGGEHAEGGLGVLPGARAGRGVAAVADREVAFQRLEDRLVEDLCDQAELLVDDDRAAVGHRHPAGLLAAVLQGVQAVVGQLGDVLAGGPDAEDTALLTDRSLGLQVVEIALSGRDGHDGAPQCKGSGAGP